jgi:Pyruvate/2-oxoacid:ferredoxin oxidoreductase delta subunit
MKLDNLFARFEKKPLNLYPGLCSGSRDQKSLCRECADVCPQGLLKVGEFGLSGESDLTGCKSCGLCATVCPNGVFEVREPTDIALVNRIKSLLENKKKLTVGCRRGGGKGGQVVCDLTLVCLGRLNEAILVAASAMGAEEILLRTSACRACQTKGLPSVIKRSVENSRMLLQAFGQDTRMVLLEEPAGAEAPEESEGKKSEETYERREFLKFLKGRTVTVAAMVAEGAIDQLKETVSLHKEQAKPVGLEHRVPAKRQILLHFLKKLGRPKLERISNATLPLAQVSIGEDCDLCGTCSQFCPTGALKAATADGAKGIYFSLSFCTGCGLCKLACLEGALSLGDTIETAGLIEDGAKRLVSHEVYRCAVCDQEFGASAPKKYCRYCERKMKLMNEPL